MPTDNTEVDFESYRLAAGMSWSKLSRETGISREMLRRYWTRPDEFKWGQIRRLQHALNVPMSELWAA